VEELLVTAFHRFLLPICCVAAVSLALADGPQNPNPAPKVVHVCVPAERQVTPHEDFIGRIDAAASVELKPRVTGYLERVLFKDGAEVKKGDVLFEIDPRPYQAQLAKAEADMSASEARFRTAKVRFERVSESVKTGAIGREELDKAAGDRDGAAANVQVARAALDSARITLGFAKVLAPIDGRIGRRLLDVGNLVKADETNLAVIVDSRSMYVNFDIDERTFRRIAHDGKASKPKEFAVAVGLADETNFPRRGKLDFIDNQVDAATGTIHVRAALFDSDKLLRPGMFCRIRLSTGKPHRALLVPNRAIENSEGVQCLLIVNEKNKIEIRPVEFGQVQSDGMSVVTNGLKAGERVALDASLASAKMPPTSVVLVDSTWQPSVEPTNEKQ
jgi:RND family efflux transporter MFP subunit